MEKKFDVIVVGGGLAGLTCAYKLGNSGLNVLVMERGKFPGSKNMWGGAFYGPILGQLIPDFWKEAPTERHIVRHILSFVSKGRCFSTSFESEVFKEPAYHNFIILRAKFDKWFAQKVTQTGAIVASGIEATDLLWNGNKVCGVKSGKESFVCDVVIACDGTNSLLAQKAGLRGELKPRDVKQGVKEIIKLSSEAIEQRFNLRNGEGVSWQFVGSCTKGLPGGAFIYTNRESLSVGIVVEIDALSKHGVNGNELLENFKESWPVRELIKGGELVEYSAHLIPVSGIKMMPRLYTDGMLVTGDAAAFVLGTGLILEGGNFAVASGIAAAETVLKCKDKGDFSSKSLSKYQELVEKSFILQDLRTFKGAAHFLENPRIYNEYPELLCSLMQKMLINEGIPRKPAWRLMREQIKGKLSILTITKDLLQGIRSI